MSKPLGRPPKVSRWMTVEEVAELFEVTPATVREWLRTKKLPGIRPGRDWKILREDVYKVAQLKYGDENGPAPVG